MNIHDIAQEAHVSIATVSRVLNKSNKVHEYTRDRVQAIIDRHGYTPNDLARGLLKNKTSSVGVLTVDILNPYYATVVHSVEQNMRGLGYHIFLCNTGGDDYEIVRYIKALLGKRVDGLVFVGSIYKKKDADSHILKVAGRIPIFMISAAMDHPDIHSILCDDQKGIQEAVTYIRGGGRRSILFINTPETPSACIKEAAFHGMLREQGCSATDCSVIEIEIDRLRELPEMIAAEFHHRRHDAILTTDDLFANVAVNTLHYLHIEIPNDVWVIGYNNSYVSEQTYPRLTSVDSRMEDIGAECAKRFDRLLSGDVIEDRITLLEPRLAVKESSA